MNLAGILGSIGGLATGAAAATGGPMAHVFMLGKLLQPGTDWKAVVAQEGEAFVRAKVQELWEKKLAADVPKVASAMTGEGWSLTEAMKPAFQASQHIDVSAIRKANTLGGFKGAAWLISRDSLYAGLRDSGLPGGAIRDGWRDASDDKIFSLIESHVTATSTVAEIVAATFAALPALTL